MTSVNTRPAQAAPLVTIGMPVYNGAATIRRALDSLVAQDYPAIEIVIADDVSRDATAAICDEYAARHPHISVRRNPANLGSYGNFSHLLLQAKGPYFVLASQDDWWDPRFVSALMARLVGNLHAVAALSGVRYFTDDPADGPISQLSGADNPERQTQRGALKALMTKQGAKGGAVRSNMYIHGVVRTDSFRESVLALNGPFLNERQLIFQWLLVGRLLYVDEVLMAKMTHEKSTDTADPFILNRQRPLFALRYVAGLVGAAWRSHDIAPGKYPLALWAAWYYLRARTVVNAVRFIQRTFPHAIAAARRIAGRPKKNA